ncbi:uncharacterized protein LOC144287740 isoform X5 [Canis aureus]
MGKLKNRSSRCSCLLRTSSTCRSIPSIYQLIFVIQQIWDEKFFLCPWMKIQSVSCLSSMTLVWTVPSFVNFWQSKYQVLRRKNKQGSTGDPTLLILTGFWFTLGTRFE